VLGVRIIGCKQKLKVLRDLRGGINRNRKPQNKEPQNVEVKDIDLFLLKNFCCSTFLVRHSIFAFY